MMRVLLVQTPCVETPSSERVYPLGVVLLASSARACGHDAAVLDMNLHDDAYRALKDRLLDFEPDVVGLSLRNIDPLGNRNTSLVIPFVAAARLTAAVLPGAVIVAGGTGFSLFPERIMKEVPEVAFGIVGEAEASFTRLLGSPASPPVNLPGLCFRKDGGRNKGGIVVNAPCRDFDMSAYVPCDRSILDPRPYSGINSYVPAMGIEGTRGCPYGCSYCVYPALQGRDLRCRPASSVVGEMEFLRGEYGVESFHFTDPVLNAPEGHLEGICGEILRRKLKVRWDGFMREDMLTAKKVALYEEAGCECFSFSPDGLSDEALQVLGKGLTEADVLGAARLVAATDVTCVYHFMVNVPGETEATATRGAETIEKLYEIHDRKKNLGTIVLNNIRILPGTRIEAIARAEGVIGPDTDLLYPTYYNPPPYEALRYRLETLHLCRNVLMWQGERQ
jgi:anaerobic magnesium-protoporphyrin IX monomethyl ester cyclase